ncbi:MAG: hypothetical protein IPJ85_12145 [Flavobacteriales bacterium]|nr:hypothetical protein [Flavobacteriales bacterium]
MHAYPHGAKAWLALSSDPDNTVKRDWDDLHRAIWEQLGLPFGDTAFIDSFNQNLPDQVSLRQHPEILKAHLFDGIHTWGDYMWAGNKGYHRPDAEAALARLRELDFKPRVWVDHSYFQGNMLHNSRYGSMPVIQDRSGHAYPNPAYTLDLVHAAGVRYLWDGSITPVLGQDRPLSDWSQQRARESSSLDTSLRLAARRMRAMTGAEVRHHDNLAYRPHRFPDGQTLYTFQRHGVWEWADIDGLGALLAPDRIEKLIRTGGTCIAYTHLGKRHARRTNSDRHITDGTMRSLENLRATWQSGALMLSSVSRMLDYLVLRDHLEIDSTENAVRLVPDGIAFTRITPDLLQGHRFTITGLRTSGLRVLGDSGALAFTTEPFGDNAITIAFQ